MNMTDYQAYAQRTANHEQDDTLRFSIAGLGLTGEAGEVAEIIKKYLGHGHELNREELKKELGDVLWYIAEAAYLAGYDLEQIAQANIDKLRERYPQGFREIDSINRSDT